MTAIDRIASAAESLRRTGEENGGPYQEPEAYRGSCARTMFDRPGSEDGSVTVLVPERMMPTVTREAYVRIPSVHSRTGEIEAEYLGVVAPGPFAEPDALGASAPTLVVAAAHGAVLTPKYHGIAQVEIFGEKVDGQMIPPVRRPCPNSPVFLLKDDEIRKVVGLDLPEDEGPVRIGLLDGANDIPVVIPAARKSVMFKHLAILGTTGGGKSTTVSGFASNLAAAGNAVVIFDVEGEYTTIHSPTDNPQMLAALKKRRLQPAGTERTRVFHLAGHAPSNPGHPDQRSFKVSFDELSPYVLVEILGLTDAQERRFLDAYDICRATMDMEKIYPTTEAERTEALEIDELARGWPRMTVEMMIDTVAAAIALIDGDLDAFRGRQNGFRGKEENLVKVLRAKKPEKDVRPWKIVIKLLYRMMKAQVFCERDSERIDLDELVLAGQVAIVDLSGMDGPYLRNLVIAQMLRDAAGETGPPLRGSRDCDPTRQARQSPG